MERSACLRISVLVSSFNYSSYVSEAVRSAQKQSLPPDEIVVVDDGSTDGSPEILRSEFGDDPRVCVESQPHRGQLAAINAGWPQITGDLVLFLDADDAFRDDHIEQTVAFFEANPDCDFAFCGYERFGEEAAIVREYPVDRDLGFSALDVMFMRTWIGGPTSTLAMRRWVLDRLLPLPFEGEWRIRADDCLVWGASLVGAHKYFRSTPTVRYRVHDRNAHYRRRRSFDERYRYVLRRDRLVRTLTERSGFNPNTLIDNAHREYRTAELPRPTRDHQRYLDLIERVPRDRRWRRRMRRRIGRYAGSPWRRWALSLRILRLQMGGRPVGSRAAPARN